MRKRFLSFSLALFLMLVNILSSGINVYAFEEDLLEGSAPTAEEQPEAVALPEEPPAPQPEPEMVVEVVSVQDEVVVSEEIIPVQPNAPPTPEPVPAPAPVQEPVPEVVPETPQEPQPSEQIEEVPEEEIVEEIEEPEEVEEPEEIEEEVLYPSNNWYAETADVTVSVSVGEGVFPEGTEMHVSPISKNVAIDAMSEVSGENTEVVDAVAVDIIFTYQGSEIQPQGSVNVSLNAKHALEGETHDAITISDSGSASVVSDASSVNSVFNTDHFTIYGIVGSVYVDEDVKHNIRHTYEFFVGSPTDPKETYTKISESTYVDGDTFSTPPAPSGDSKHPFTGWFVVDENYNAVEEIVNGSVVSIDPINTENATSPEEAVDKTFKVYAMFGEAFKVTFYTNEEMSLVYDTFVVPENENITFPSATDVANDGLVLPDGKRFAGWKNVANDEIFTNEVFAVAEDTDFIPVYETAHSIKFNTVRPVFDNVVIAEQSVLNGEFVTKPSDFTEGETYVGYTFGGWFKNYNSNEQDLDVAFTEPFDFDTAITDEDEAEILLFAKWVPKEVTFTVEVYLENANDTGYSRDTSEVMQGTADELIPVDSILGMFSNDSYRSASPGFFHLNKTGATDDETDPCAIQVLNKDGRVVANYDVNTSSWDNIENAKIASDNSTIVKVNYSRDTYNLYFLFKNHGKSNITDADTTIDWVTGGRTLNENGKAYAPENYENVTLPILKIKYGQHLGRFTHEDESMGAMFDAFLATAPWYFEKKNFGSGQTVFNNNNLMFPIKPTNGAPDDGNICMAVYLLEGQKEFPIIANYYENYYSAEQILSGMGTVVSTNDRTVVYTPGHIHNWEIGSLNDGYELVAVTGFDSVKNNSYVSGDVIPKGSYAFRFVNGSSKTVDTLPIILHYVPVSYSITFKQTKTDGKINGWNVTNDTIKEEIVVSDIAVGQDITEILNANAPTGWNTLKDERGVVYSAVEGWKGGPDGAGTFPKKMPAKNLVYYKDWVSDTYIVSFDVNYNTQNASHIIDFANLPFNSRVPSGDVYNTRPGWTLVRWEAYERTEENGVATPGAKISDNFNFNTPVTTNLYLKAIWAKDAGFKVEYDAGEFGQFKNNETGTILDSKIYMTSASVPLKYLPTPDKGYVFTGYKVEGTDNIIKTNTFSINDTGLTFNSSSNDLVIKLVAQYDFKEDVFTDVVYHSNFPDGTINQQVTRGTKVLFGDNKPSPSLIVNGNFVIEEDAASLSFVPEGKYEFVCWSSSSSESIYSNSSLIEYFNKGEEVGVGANGNHLYAVWKIIPERDAKIIKVDENGNVLNGATLQLLDENKNVISTFTAGEYIIKDTLQFGKTYYVREIEAPEFYEKIKTDIPFVLTDATNIQEVRISNALTEKNPVSVVLKARKIFDKELTGGEFAFALKNDKGATIQTVTNNASGEITFMPIVYTEENIGTHNYTIEEVKGNIETINYDEGIINVKVDVIYNKTEYDLSANVFYTGKDYFENTTKTFEVELSKQDIASHEELPGATLILKDSTGKEIETWVSDGTPHKVVNLEAGTYVLSEVSAPAGYIKANDITFTINANGTITGETVMYDDYTKVKIVKVDENGDVLDGAVLQILDASKNVIIESFTAGEYIVNKLEVGKTYYVREITAPEFYKKLGRDVAFVVKDSASVQEVSIQNIPVDKDPVSVTIKTSKRFDKELAGGEFEFALRDEFGGIIQTASNNADGQVIFLPITYLEENIGTHKYTITENVGNIQTINYDDNVIDVEVEVFAENKKSLKANVNVSSQNGRNYFENTTKTFEVELSKQDIASHEELAGATLVLKDSTGKEIETWVSNGTPHKVTNLEAGTYVLSEIEAPKGYLKANDITFTINANGTITGETVMSDEYTKVRIVKIDEEGNVLDGATMQLLNENKEVVIDSFVAGEYLTEKLEVGKTYYVREVEAPKFYKTLTEDVAFVVANSSSIQEVRISNALTEKNPVSVVLEAKKVFDKELAGGEFKFDLKDADGNILQTVSNNASGEITFMPIVYTEENVGTHNYTIEEVKGNVETINYDEGVINVKVDVIYNKTEYDLSANVSYTGKEYFENTTKTFEVELSKQDITTKEEITGATLILKDSTGKEIETWVSDGTPHKVVNLEAGTYVLSEISAPAGYIKANNITFTINANGTVSGSTVMFDDYTKVRIIKIDENGDVLNGATMQLLNENKEVVIDSFVVGEYLTEKLEVGKTYYVRELEAPEFYKELDRDIAFIVKDSASVQEVSIQNIPVDKDPVSVTIKTSKSFDKQLTGGEFEFELKDVSGNVIQTTTNNADGQVIFLPITYLEENIGTHKYTITEKTGNIETINYDDNIIGVEVEVFAENKKSLKANVSASSSKGRNYFENTTKTFEVELSKQDIASQEELPGATLVLKDNAGKEIKTWISGTTPHKVANLEAGTYVLSEVSAPKGYLKTNDITFTVNANGTVSGKTVMSDDYTKVRIIKVDEEGKILNDASMQLLDENKNVVVESFTAGEFIVNKLEVGKTYYVRELEAPEFYKTLTEDVAFVVMDSASVQEVRISNALAEKNPVSVVLSTKKVFDRNLAGGEFEFALKDDKGATIQTATNNASGEITFMPIVYTEENVGTHNYTIEEVKGNVETINYDEGVINVKVDVIYNKTEYDLSANVSYTGKEYFENTTKTFEVELSKQDITTKEELPGATLVLKDSTGKEIETWVSDGTPHKVANLEAGTYVLSEVSAPAGYIKANDITFTINANGTITGETVMYDDYTKVKIVKKDLETEEVLENAVMQLLDENKNVIENFTAGEYLVEKLEVGKTYYVREVEAPEFYKALEEDVAFVVADTASVQEVSIVNALAEKNPVSVVLGTTKIFDKNLTGGEFEFVLQNELGFVLETVSNTASGQVVFSPLVFTEDMVGTHNYRIIETKGNDDTIIYDEEFIDVKIDVVKEKYEHDLKTEVSYSDKKYFENTTKTFEVELSKQDITSKEELAGATLVLKDSTGKEIETWVSDGTPHKVANLEAGTYVLSEIEAPKGYVKADDITFAINTNGDITGDTIMFDALTKVVIVKKDALTLENLVGVKLQVLDSEENVIEEFESSEIGHTIEGLEAGTYFIREVEAPEGYRPLDSYVEFVVSDNPEELNKEVVVYNDKMHNVSLSKQDITTREEIVGASLRLTNSEGEEIDVWISEETPHVIEDILPGSYTLTEVEAPSGYLVSEPVSFTVTEDGTITGETVMLDDYTKLEILKVDESNTPISGARLRLTNAAGEVVSEWVSSSRAEVFNRLPAGSYTLTEVSAPSGYELASPVEFEVNNESDVKTVSIVNVRTPEPPAPPEIPITPPVPEDPTPTPPTPPVPEAPPTTPFDNIITEGVLGVRKTNADTPISARRMSGGEAVLGARKAKTGDVSMASNYAIMASAGLLAIILGKKKKEK